MQKLAEAHDTDVGISLARLLSRCAAAPQAGAAPDREVAGWPPAEEPDPCPAGAGDDRLHPVAAPASRTNTQANASHSRPVMPGRLAGDVLVDAARCASVICPSVLSLRCGPIRYQAVWRARVPAAVTLAVTILARIPLSCQGRAALRPIRM